MKQLFLGLVLTAVWCSAEVLHFTINWQSGLSLGEATIESNKSPDGLWTASLTMDAAVPGYTIRDEYRSEADAKFCAQWLEKTTIRGSRKSSEKGVFDQDKHKLKRETQGGGGSESQIAECAHDALTFVQYVRQELAQGRVAPNQSVYLGSKYDLQLIYVGMETIKQGDQRIEADRVRVSSHGPKSDVTFDLYFSRDDVRTPVLARLPLSLGVFTVELLP